MHRTAIIVATLALLSPLTAAALPAAGGVAQTGGNATANTTDPGAQFAGVVGSQGARIDGEVEERSFSVRLERANSTEERASVVASVVKETNATVDELQARLEELRSARESGNITESTYRARVAIVAERIETARGLANRSADAAAELPEAALRERGVSAAAARNLSKRASKLGGPEVAAIARNITGRERAPGAKAGGGPPEDTPAGGEDARNDAGGAGESGNAPGGASDSPTNRSEAGGERGADSDARNESGSDANQPPAPENGASDDSGAENGTETNSTATNETESDRTATNRSA